MASISAHFQISLKSTKTEISLSTLSSQCHLFVFKTWRRTMFTIGYYKPHKISAQDVTIVDVSVGDMREHCGCALLLTTFINV